MAKEKLSVIIPCYYSEKSLRQVVDEVVTVIEADSRYDYEVILINDGSTDGTWKVIQELCGDNAKIKGINLSKNYGQHSALMAGFRAVSGDIVVGLDDDGEHNPAEMFKLIDKLKEGYDYVAADYGKGKKSSLFRNMGTAVNERMARSLVGLPKEAVVSSFFVERRFVADQIAQCTNTFPYIIGLLLQATDKLGNVKLQRRERLYGRSGYNFRKLLALWVNGFTAFSVKPLRIATILGFLVSFAGFAFGIYLIINKLFHPEVQLGWSSIMSTILFVGGAIMLLLGMLGEYIGRIYININNNPQYVVRERVNLEND